MSILPIPDTDFTETGLGSTTRYRGRMLEVREDEVRLPDGGQARREYVVHPGAAVILPIFDDWRILLERQFRYPRHDHFLELPAGKFDAGEAPITTARRELREETGCIAADWHHLCTLYPCVGYSDEVVEMFVARGLTFERPALDPGEFLETLLVPLDEALAWIRSGVITEAKTILGLFWADRLRAGWPLEPKLPA